MALRYNLVILVFLLITLASCEGYVTLRGHVYDADTRLPIRDARAVMLYSRGGDTVMVDVYTAERRRPIEKVRQAMSDSLGFFEISSGLVGCVPDCPRFRGVVGKEGYVLTASEGQTDSIFLKRN